MNEILVLIILNPGVYVYISVSYFKYHLMTLFHATMFGDVPCYHVTKIEKKKTNFKCKFLIKMENCFSLKESPFFQKEIYFPDFSFIFRETEWGKCESDSSLHKF